MFNVPEVKLGIVSVSRDCFVLSLSARRVNAVAGACKTLYGIDAFLASTIVENETDMQKALEEVKNAGCNALLVFLGNFGPETPETLLAKYFEGPVMYAAAGEESMGDLINGRGDAFCGMLNCSYNLGLRKIKAVIPEYPVGTAGDIAGMVADFIPVARALIGVAALKLISFGPRPQDFFACNAPIKGLYDMGIEIQENSELDLLESFNEHCGDPRIAKVSSEMAEELGAKGNQYPDILPRLAQYELTLLDWAEQNKGAKKYVAFANKCWPAFPRQFKFMPCYVNSRLASNGMPVSCEVDIYGALSEYIGACVTMDAVTLLDINNTVPADLYESEIKGKFANDYKLADTFMGFHCGNTPICKLSDGAGMKFQLIMNRLMESGGSPDITRGTLEGDFAPGKLTFYRLHANPDSSLQAYIAEGEVLPVATRSFGGIGVMAIPEMARFYRHVLIEKRYPHHGALVFAHAGKALYTVFEYLGAGDIAYNRPAGRLYDTENPFA